MTVINMNKLMLDMPMWEQLPFAPATGVAGTCMVDDDRENIYVYIQTSATASQFWKFDTFANQWQQLATPPTQTGTVANMEYMNVSGGQFNGRTFGAIFLFVGNGTTCYFYRYNIATNTWSANLGTTGIPATFATDCYLLGLAPRKNNFEGGYHSGVTRTITTTGIGALNATTLAVSALPETLPVGAKLRFGVFNITLAAPALKGATSLSVSALPNGIANGTVLSLQTGIDIIVNGDTNAGATTLNVYPIQQGLANGTIIEVHKYVVLTAQANSGATSITVAPLLYTIGSGDFSYYYGNMYLVGNNATVMYRFNLGSGTWSTTSANSGNPAFPSITGAVGTGCAIKWMTAYDPNKLIIVRGNATNNIYQYDLVANTISTLTIQPATETFTTGTSVASRTIGGKRGKILIQKEATGRIYEFDPIQCNLNPKNTQYAYPMSTVVVGDKSCCLTSPDGIEFYYNLLHSSTAFLRCAMIDS